MLLDKDLQKCNKYASFSVLATLQKNDRYGP